MRENLKLDLSKATLSQSDMNVYNNRLGKDNDRLMNGNEDFRGWTSLPVDYDKAELERVIQTANKIKEQCEAFIIIGIGGSYLGAKAAVEMLTSNTAQPNHGRGVKGNPAIYFAGNNISGTYHAELIDVIREKETCLCVISKSGATTEPLIAFSILKDELYRKHGQEGAHGRIYAITDASKGVLRAETDKNGYVSFIVPDDIGGRYSVLTPVGLLPIAVAGIDVKQMLEGAADSYKENKETDSLAFQYAVARNLLHTGSGKKMIEVYEYYEPKLQYFTEWLKQLFGESEGKEGKGIFPASLQFSADLHSMGQFLQDGSQIFFETVLHVAKPEKDLIVPQSAGALLAGRSMNDVNNAAVEGVMAAHQQAGIPIIKIDIPQLTPYYFGKMVYFFEKSCAIGSYLLEVDPFNQPGVESYKAEMRKCLEK